MIVLEGNITNKVIHGVNGDFSVGNFTTDIGKFKIRDQLLDQFDEGEYRVQVSIKHLDLNSYVSKQNGIIITEIHADIDHIQVIDADIKTVESASVEPDASVDEAESSLKADDKSTKQKPAVKRDPGKSTVDSKKQSRQTKPQASQDEDTELKKLFGMLWPLADVVQLDSTTPRAQFIRQKDYLKTHGYRFHSPDQTWHKE